MAGRYAFDCETDGLLPELTKLHCLAITDLDTGVSTDYADRPGFKRLALGLAILSEADLLVGHNIIGFDLKAIKKVYPKWTYRGLVRDTFVLTRLLWPHIKDGDFKRAEQGRLPKNMIGRHSLEAWGYRLGILKGTYTGGWENWNPDMHAYMIQDVAVTVALWLRAVQEAATWDVPIEDPNPPARKDCVELEHRVAEIVEKVQDHGVRFNTVKAVALAAKVTARKEELEPILLEAFPPAIVKTPFTPKKDNKAKGYKKGVVFIKERLVPFNPASRQQVAARLQELGWQPAEFGKDGTPTVDDEILKALPYSEARVLAEYFMLDKRLGQIANGKEAWLRHEKNGRIHGRIHSGGAHTGRMTHSNPNLAQVPGCIDKKTGEPMAYGPESRDCFEADEGYVLVGCDADALELRDLAGYMANWDDGAYIETVLRGDKKIGTDMHTINARLMNSTRDAAKIFFYAMIYGSGDYNLGTVLGITGRAASAAGKAARGALMQGVPALGALVKAVEKKFRQQKFITGLDGRRLSAKSMNAIVNTLLQSAGAIQMKRGLVVLYDSLHAKGWEFGNEYAISLLVHDEWQANVRPDLAEAYGEIASQSIRDAGTFYNFRCPLDAQFNKGATWRETH